MALMLWSSQAFSQTVFINEIHYDNAGDDAGEAVEILGPAGTNLTGWSVVAYNGNGGASYLTIDLTGLILPNELNGYGAVQVLAPGLQNGSPDGIALVNNGTLVQFLSYEGSFAASNGPANGVSGTDIGVSESSGAALGSAMQLQGTGTQYSDFTWVSADLPSSFGAINANQVIGEIVVEDIIVINEVDADQTGTDATEFVELFDGGNGNTALDGLVLVLFNGSDNLSYNAISLDGYSTDADGYFVIGSALVQNVDLVAFTENGIQNGADAVALYSGEVANFPTGTGITTEGLIDALVYGTSDPTDPELIVLLNEAQIQVDENLNGNAVGESMQRLPNGSGGARNTSTYGMLPPTPGAENGEAPEVTLIHAIQGSGLSSSLVGSFVVIEGIVVGDFQTTASGFYVQEEDSDADADELTSEGIFVFAPASIDVAEGDLVRVEGTVVEFFELTELTNVSSVEILASNQSLPLVTEITLPLPDATFLERFEGMLIRFPQTLSVTNNFLIGRGGELGLSFGNRLYQGTHLQTPGADALALEASNMLNYIIIDDASTLQNPDPTLFPTGGLLFENTVRGGDEVSNVQGVMTYAWSGFNLSGVSTNAYRVYTTEDPTFTPANARADSLPETGGSFKVASFNVLNYFNGDGLGGGFPTARGANSQLEFDRQRVKIINAILALDAAVVGLIEIENDGYGANSAIQDLVNGLNEMAGEGTYAVLDLGSPQIGTDEIAVGFIYQPALAQPNGAAVILDSSVDPTFDDTRNRPALLQNFADVASGNSINVVVNHLKSKGSDCNDIGDIDLGDGQGNCNQTRTSAAIALANWLETDPSQQNSPYNLIIGDLNAYAKEDPIVALQNLGYTDILHATNGSNEYSFQFGGRWGYLDYAMANQALLELTAGAAVWKINADEPAVFDYNVEFKSPGQVESFYSESAFRSSDHDPVVVGFDLLPADCFGVSGGQGVIDECGVCRLSDDPDFNSTCADCLGIPNGEAIAGSPCFENELEGTFDADCICIANPVEQCRYFLSNYNSNGGSDIYEMAIDEDSLVAELTFIISVTNQVSLAYDNNLLYLVRENAARFRTLNVDANPPVLNLSIGAGVNINGWTGATCDETNNLYGASASNDAIFGLNLDEYSGALFSGAGNINQGDIAYHAPNEILLVNRNPNRAVIVRNSAPNLNLGAIPANASGLAKTIDGRYLISFEGSNELMLFSTENGDLGVRYALTLDGVPFVAGNGDMASGCMIQAAAAPASLKENMTAAASLSNLYSLPNPTEGMSTVVYQPSTSGSALLEVYDIRGVRLATIFNLAVEAGQVVSSQFDGSALPNGVYLYRLTTDSEVKVEKFMIAR